MVKPRKTIGLKHGAPDLWSECGGVERLVEKFLKSEINLEKRIPWNSIIGSEVAQKFLEVTPLNTESGSQLYGTVTEKMCGQLFLGVSEKKLNLLTTWIRMTLTLTLKLHV